MHELALRSQSQAEYAAENDGNFGLNLRRYAHSNLPNPPLRGSDLQRGLLQALGLAHDRPASASLPEVAAQISATERRAMLAERDSVDRLIATFLATEIGATFEGRVSGVTRAGVVRAA